MATTGLMNGTLLGLYIGGTLIAKATSHTININQSLRETTNKDSSGWKESLEGLRDWSIDCDALHGEDNTYGFTDIFALMTSRAAVTVKFSTEVSGDNKYSGSARITSLTKNAGVEDTVSYSASFEGTAALTEGAVT